MSAIMNSQQVSDFLSRNAAANTIVAEFEIENGVIGGYTNVTTGSVLDSSIADSLALPTTIPPQGIEVQDSVYGNVLISPNASGQLNFVLDAPSGYGVSVPAGGASLLSSLLPMLPSFPSLPSLGSVEIVGVLAILVFAYSFGRK